MHQRHVAVIRIPKCGTTAGIEESVDPWDTLVVVVMETDIALSKIVRDVAAGEDSMLPLLKIKENTWFSKYLINCYQYHKGGNYCMKTF